MSPAHLQRYVDEFAGRHNQRPMDTAVQMRMMAQGMVGKRLHYRDLKVGEKHGDVRVGAVGRACITQSAQTGYSSTWV